MPSTSEAEAEAKLWGELNDLKEGNITDYEMEKVKNKFEANMLMGEINIMNKALNLCFYAMTGDTDLVNREAEIYRSLTRDELMLRHLPTIFVLLSRRLYHAPTNPIYIFSMIGLRVCIKRPKR